MLVREEGSRRATPPNPDFAASEAFRTRTYWLLAVAIGARLMAQSSLMVHMVPILVSRGIGEGTAAALVAIVALVRLPMMVGAGFVADRWSRTNISALAMVIGIGATATTVLGPEGLATGLAFAVLFASAQASNSVTWALIGQFFGRTSFGTLRGGVTMVQSLMSTAGPLTAGWVFDHTGSYTMALIGIGAVYAVSALLFWGLRAPTSH